MKKLRVTIEGKSYDVTVEMLDEDAKPVASQPKNPTRATEPAPLDKSQKSTKVSGPGRITIPLSGKLVSIDVKVGQIVDEGTQLATVEAMKMNTYIFSHLRGRVDNITGQVGDIVEEGTVIMSVA